MIQRYTPAMPAIVASLSVKETITGWLVHAQGIGDVTATIENLEHLEAALDTTSDLEDLSARSEQIRRLLEERDRPINEILDRAHGLFAEISGDEILLQKLASSQETPRALGIAGSDPPPSQNSLAASSEKLRALIGRGKRDRPLAINVPMRDLLYLVMGTLPDLTAIIAYENSSHSSNLSLLRELSQAEEASYRVWHSLQGALRLLEETGAPREFVTQIRKSEEKARHLMRKTHSERDALSERIGGGAPRDDLDEMPGEPDIAKEDPQLGSLVAAQLNQSLLILLNAWSPTDPRS